jgi:RNA polymerase primary sigma factor
VSEHTESGARDDSHQRRLLRAARRGDRGAQARLTARYLGLVRTIASGYRGLGMPFDDLVQEGSLGLLDAFVRYDPGRGVDFERFARFRVRRAIRNALTQRARLVRLPKQIVERRRALDRVEAGIALAAGRPLTPAQLSAASALPVAAVVRAREAAITPVPLDGPTGFTGIGLTERLVDVSAADPETSAIAADEARRLREAVRHLDSRQREIVSRHFGLSRPEEPLRRVAADLRLSEQRARALELDALARLARELEPAAVGQEKRLAEAYCLFEA